MSRLAPAQTPRPPSESLTHAALKPRPRTVAYALAATFSVTMLWFTANAFMWLDDYELQSLAYAAPWFTWEYLSQPWGGHFMPAAFALAQALAKSTPFTYVPMIAFVSTGMCAFAFASARLFLTVLGDRWRALIPLALVLASGAVWDAATWWIAALNAVPLLVAIPLATHWHLQWLQHGRWHSALAAWATVCVACLFFEKSLGLIFFLALITVALRGRWHPVRRTWQVPTLVLLYAATAAFVAVGYVASATGAVARASDVGTLLEFIRVGALTFPTLLVGGPWQWTAPSIAATPLPLALLCAAALLAWVALQSLRSRRALLLWAGVCLYVLGLILVVAAGRSGWGVQVIAQPRYFVDAVVYAVTASTLAWAFLGPTSSPRLTGDRRRVVASIAGAVVLTELLVLGLALTIPFLARAMQNNESRTYVLGAVSTLTGGQEKVNNGLVPGNVMWPLVAPRNQLRFVFSPVADPDRFPDVRDSLVILDGFGMLRPGAIAADPIPPPPGPCPWPLRERRTIVSVPDARPDYWHTVRFAYLAGAPTSVELGFGKGAPVLVPLSPGLHEAFAFIPGGGDELIFTRVPDGVGVCVSEVSVGLTEEKAP